MTTQTISKVRCATVEQLNAIVNRPDVLPHLGGSLGSVVDIRTVAGWRRMEPLTCGDGCMLFLEERPQIWRTDLLFIPGHRSNLRDARAMVTYLFEHKDALGVFGLTPRKNVRACRFVEALPGIKVGEEDRYSVYAAKRQDWPWLTKREQTTN